LAVHSLIIESSLRVLNTTNVASRDWICNCWSNTAVPGATSGALTVHSSKLEITNGLLSAFDVASVLDLRGHFVASPRTTLHAIAVHAILLVLSLLVTAFAQDLQFGNFEIPQVNDCQVNGATFPIGPFVQNGMNCNCAQGGSWTCNEVAPRVLNTCDVEGRQQPIGNFQLRGMNCQCAAGGTWNCGVGPAVADPISTCSVGGINRPQGAFDYQGMNCQCAAGGTWNCATAPRAGVDSTNEFSSTSVGMPSYVVTLIVVGSIVAVLFVAVLIQLVVVLRSLRA